MTGKAKRRRDRTPTTKEEYLARFHAGTKIEGYGMDVHTVMPCPWCAAPGFQRLYSVAGIMPGDDRPNIDEQMETVHTCSECGRSGRAIVKRDESGVSFEFVQTGGPDAPGYLVPAPRRVDGSDD